MKKVFYAFLFFLTALALNAQDLQRIAGEIEAEGKMLYRLEKASWHGTDLFLTSYSGTMENVGGYFSYPANDGKTLCVFYDRKEIPTVIGVVSFDSLFMTTKTVLDLTERNMTNIERDICSMRSVALKEVQTDTLFEKYPDTSLNLIPLIYKGEKKVYVLTSPLKPNVVFFGNDYLITLDEEYSIKKKQKLHETIISKDYGSGEKEKVTSHVHLHEGHDFISPTDICTLMLYAGTAGWKEHCVVSREYVSIWNSEKNKLSIMTMGDFENKLDLREK